MKRLDAAKILDVWETGQCLHPLDRAVLLACAALPGRTRDEVADLPIGARDAAILRLRRVTIEDRLGARADCLACGETCEVWISIQSLLEHEATTGVSDTEKARLPTSRDLAAILLSDTPAPDHALAARCLGKQPGAALDDAAVADLSDWVARHDPLSEIRLALVCHACSHNWEETLDPPSFFWREIEVRAWRVFNEVDCLARAYGWSQRDVLSLSEARRAAYLERAT